MHKVWLIARREYIERIRTRGFMVMTVLIPVLMFGFLFGSAYMNSKSRSVTHIAAVSADTRLILDLQSEFESNQASQILIDPMNPGPDTQRILDEELDSGNTDGYLWITPAPLNATPAVTFTPRSSAQ